MSLNPATTTKVYLAADHAGYALKQILGAYLQERGYLVEDIGAAAFSPEDDYPDFITPCAEKVSEENQRGGGAAALVFGIIIGGSGQGEAMAANRVRGVRTAVFYGGATARAAIDASGAPSQDTFDIVRLAREHNNANILSLGARFISEEDARRATEIFLETPFSNAPRHLRRIAKY